MEINTKLKRHALYSGVLYLQVFYVGKKETISDIHILIQNGKNHTGNNADSSQCQ